MTHTSLFSLFFSPCVYSPACSDIHQLVLTFPNLLQQEKTYTELVQDCRESGEESSCFLVASDKAFGVADDDGREDGGLHSLTHPLEVVGDADELLHLTEILGFDLLKGRPELKPLLPKMRYKNGQQ